MGSLLGGDEMILDIGPRSIEHVCPVLARVKTLVWNGPFGAFEFEPFDIRTVEVAEAASKRGPSVLSQGRSVPLPVPSISRTRRFASGSESTMPSRTTDPPWFTTQIDACFSPI